MYHNQQQPSIRQCPEYQTNPEIEGVTFRPVGPQRRHEALNNLSTKILRNITKEDPKCSLVSYHGERSEIFTIIKCTHFISSLPAPPFYSVNEYIFGRENK